MNTIITKSEIQAYNLLVKAGDMCLSTWETDNIKKAAAKIIALAEAIKAERLDAAMQRISDE